MADDFKRAARNGGCDCCNDPLKANGQARAALKVSDVEILAFAEEWRDEFEWLSQQ